MQTITRQQAIELYGSAAALAEALGYASRHAVYMWAKERVPREPYLRLRYELRPEAFDRRGNYIGPPPAAPLPAEEEEVRDAS